ncbi:MAG: alpha-mannosidase [Kiritimatiellae bacterium]|nr:alpha-mannosidase [Kiritimatiellia bacterium]
MTTHPHPLLQLTFPRTNQARRRLQVSLWSSAGDVDVRYMSAEKDAQTLSDVRKQEFETVTLPFHWGRLMHTRWFHLRFSENDSGRTRYVRWRDQGEGTLYIDGVPYYGFDVAHREVAIPTNCREAYVEALCLQSGIWHPEAKGLDPEGSCLTEVGLFHRNDQAWDALIELDVWMDLIKDESDRCPHFAGVQQNGIGNKAKVEVVSPLLRRLLRMLDDAIIAFDAKGLSALHEAFDQMKSALKSEGGLVKGVLTGHAHIDLVWLWKEANAEYKARHTFASMNRLMELYPEFRFAYSQSASYDAVQASSPELMEQVRNRMKEGKWEAVGATYVESDTMMACGEALARSFLVGQERFRDLFGESSNLLWLPDVFGYCGCLPQIMRQCGVERFFTTKLTWSNISLFPHSSFVWRGTDGSEVVSHVTQGLGYNQEARPHEVRKAADEHRQSDVHDEFLMPTGYGDGGGGVTPEMCERARRFQALEGVPNTTWGRLDEFYDRLEALKDRLPVYQGELYLEYHRGTLTTHGELKKAFRALERALQLQEASRVLTGGGPIDVHVWKRLVFAQFHDYIPGSSIHEVYEEGVPELVALAETAMADVSGTFGEGNCVVNLLPMSRPYLADDGLVLLPPMSSVNPGSLKPFAPVPLVEQSDRALNSGRVSAVFNDCGEVSELMIDGDEVLFDHPLNRFMLYSDYPHQFDAWDIDRQTLETGIWVDSEAQRVDWSPENGIGLAFKRSIGEKSQVEIRYWIDPAHPALQIELLLDWHETHKLLKSQFSTRYMGRFTRFGSPFGSVLRSQQPGDLKDEAMFESGGSRWATVMDDSQSQGLSIITESKYGFSCREGQLGLSLIRSVPVTGEDTQHEQVVSTSIRDGEKRDVYSDRGLHRIRYAVSAHTASTPREEQAAALADQLYSPLYRGEKESNAGLKGRAGGESLIPAWSKPLANGDWILRLHEVLGRSGRLQLDLADGWKAERTDLSERPGGAIGDSLSFRAYEIVSVRLSQQS